MYLVTFSTHSEVDDDENVRVTKICQSINKSDGSVKFDYLPALPTTNLVTAVLAFIETIPEARSVQIIHKPSNWETVIEVWVRD